MDAPCLSASPRALATPPTSLPLYCVLQGWNQYVEKLPGVQAPFDPATSYFDEAVGYTIGAIGLFWQLSTGFSPPLPFNILLLPLEIVEWILRWQITFSTAPSVGVAGG